MIRILSRTFLKSCQFSILENERHKLERQHMGRMNSFFSSFLKIREQHRDIKEHSNNKVITNI